MVEEEVEHGELGLRGIDLNLFDEEREECVGGKVKDLTYLLILMKLWPGYWEDNIDRINNKVDEENEGGGTQENGLFQKLWRFSRK